MRTRNNRTSCALSILTLELLFRLFQKKMNESRENFSNANLYSNGRHRNNSKVPLKFLIRTLGFVSICHVRWPTHCCILGESHVQIWVTG